MTCALAGTTRGISIAGQIPGSETDSESLRLLRPTLLSLAGYFNTSSVSQEAVQLLQVGFTPHDHPHMMQASYLEGTVSVS